MRRFAGIVVAAWIVFAMAFYIFPDVHPAFWAASIGAGVTLAIAFTNWSQSKRQTVLELHKEYYSHSFAECRGKASRFFKRYGGTDWTKTNPHSLPDLDDTLSGYSQVLRFWHRVAVLYQSDALNKRLAKKLLSRELGHWFGFVFEGMEARDDMYTRDLLFELIKNFRSGRGKHEFERGAADGRRRKSTSPSFKWVRGSRRWTTKGRSAS